MYFPPAPLVPGIPTKPLLESMLVDAWLMHGWCMVDAWWLIHGGSMVDAWLMFAGSDVASMVPDSQRTVRYKLPYIHVRCILPYTSAMYTAIYTAMYTCDVYCDIQVRCILPYMLRYTVQHIARYILHK